MKKWGLILLALLVLAFFFTSAMGNVKSESD